VVWEWEDNFDECEDFDYGAYKANGFALVDPRETALRAEPRGLNF
jgi:ribose 5-phosphate isomerase B